MLLSFFASLLFFNCEKKTDTPKISDSELFFRQTIDNDISTVKELNGWSTPVHPWSQDPIIKMWVTFRTDDPVLLKFSDKYISADEEKEKFISWFISFASENGYKNEVIGLDSLDSVTIKRFNRQENGAKGKYFYFYNSKTKKHYLYYEN